MFLDITGNKVFMTDAVIANYIYSPAVILFSSHRILIIDTISLDAGEVCGLFTIFNDILRCHANIIVVTEVRLGESSKMKPANK